MAATLKKITTTIFISLTIFLSGCATTGTADKRDPIEGLNRAIYSFNDSLDNAIFKPVAKGYRTVVPDPIDMGVTNFFGNINDFVTTINDLLQFKIRQGGSDAFRVLVNTTIGLLGIFDVATIMGFEKHDEDFGQTLGYWGVGNGPYLVLPIYGPSTLRDATGRLVDAYNFDPIYQISHVPSRNSLRLIEGLDKRADLLSASTVMDKAALDRYDFLKESYLQEREFQVNDGEVSFPE